MKHLPEKGSDEGVQRGLSPRAYPEPVEGPGVRGIPRIPFNGGWVGNVNVCF